MHRGFTIATVVNPPDIKLVNPTSVHWEGYIFFNAIYTEGSTVGFSEYIDVGDLLHTAICYRPFRVMGYFLIRE